LDPLPLSPPEVARATSDVVEVTGDAMVIVEVSPAGGQAVSVSLTPELAASLVTQLGITGVQAALEPVAPESAEAQAASLSGNAVPLGPPLSVKLSLFDAQGTVVLATAGETTADSALTIMLPALPPLADGVGVAMWSQATYDESGVFLGYAPALPALDPQTGTVAVQAPLALLQGQIGRGGGAVFLPAAITPSYVANFDPDVHLFSGPTSSAVDFGPVPAQFTVFMVLGPPVGGRLFVYDPASVSYGWIDASGVGPA
jgi:hypothetical protein